jgi:hypothetical protein
MNTILEKNHQAILWNIITAKADMNLENLILEISF